MSQSRPLERQLLVASGLVTAGQTVVALTRVGAQLALARLLAPDEFGLYGLALLVTLLVTAVVEDSLLPALVRAGEDEGATSSGLALASGLGLALYAALWLASPLLASLFGQPALADVLRVTGLAVPFAGLTVAPAAVLERRQRFDRRVLIGLGGAVGGALTSLALALAGAGVFALAWGWAAGLATSSVVAWSLAGWWPRARPSPAAARKLVVFGRFTAGSGLLVITVSNLDDAIVGAVLGVQALGFYGLAYGWANLLSRLLVGPISAAVFPTYLRASAEPGRLSSLYLGVARTTVAIIVPAAALLVLLGPAAAVWLLGSAWTPVGPLLQVMSLLLLARGLMVSQGAFFNTLGRPHWRPLTLTIELGLLVVGLVPAARAGGLLGVAVLVSVAALVTTTIGLALISRLLEREAWRLALALAQPSLAAGFAALAVVATEPLRQELGLFLYLVSAGMPFVAVYALALVGLWVIARPWNSNAPPPTGRVHDAPS